MPRIYDRYYCVRCGIAQRLCVIKLVCDNCFEKKIRCNNEFYYDYYTGKKRDFKIVFN